MRGPLTFHDGRLDTAAARQMQGSSAISVVRRMSSTTSVEAW